MPFIYYRLIVNSNDSPITRYTKGKKSVGFLRRAIKRNHLPCWGLRKLTLYSRSAL
jgi:hypothetical protein